jgi:thymidylate synthase (FAD)
MNSIDACHVDVHHTLKGTPFLTEPGVVLLSRPEMLSDELATFLAGFDASLEFNDYLSDPVTLSPADALAKTAGQTCYASFGPKRTWNENAGRYFQNIKSSGHGSVLEHATFSMLFYGVSRSLTHELVRHRAGTAMSQISQRYVDGRVLRFVERPEFQSHPGLHTLFMSRIDRAAGEYEDLADLLEVVHRESLEGFKRTERRKIVNQAARASLPNEVEAPIVFSGNCRAWRHMLEARGSAHAEPEIRALFHKVLRILQSQAPMIFSDYRLEPNEQGVDEVATEFRKV